MNRVLSTIMVFLSLSSLVFVSCEKDGGKGENNENKKICYFNAKVQMSQDLIDACESISFEYKDAEGKKVTAEVKVSDLKAAKYSKPFTDTEIDVLEWSCKFDYKNYPAEVYFKPAVQIKENVSFEHKPSFIFYPAIYSGVHNGVDNSNYDSANLKLNIDIDKAATILSSLSNTINSIEVDTTVE